MTNRSEKSLSQIVGWRVDGAFLDALHILQEKFPGRFQPTDTYVLAAMEVFERHCRTVIGRIDETQYEQFQQEAPVYAKRILLLAAQQYHQTSKPEERDEKRST